MNKDIVINVIGKILLVEALLMIFPFLVSLYYHEDLIYTSSFIIVILIESLLGFILTKRKVKDYSFYTLEGFFIVAFSWIVLSFFGSLPFVISGDIPSMVDAFFEISSGFTTTGASIIGDVEALAKSMLWWRSFTHLIGGMGVLVFALAIIPNSDSKTVYIMKAEVPGPQFGKLMSRVSQSARVLYIIYLAMTLITIVFLLLGGMPLFDATLLSFGAAGTGGFGVRNGSILPYDSLYTELVLATAMIIFGVNFNLYYALLNKNIKAVYENEELRLYLKIILIAISLITINLVLDGTSIKAALRDSYFTVASIITTTGYSTADFGLWPIFSKAILLVLMFTGAMAGSTAGGLKISRIGILIQSAKSEFKRMKNPNRLVLTKYEGKALESNYLVSVLNYLVIYILIFVALVLIVSLEAPDFITAFSSVAATFNNIGPGLGLVGPVYNYSLYSPFMKIVLSIGMIMGRLEIFPILILFSRDTYKK